MNFYNHNFQKTISAVKLTTISNKRLKKMYIKLILDCFIMLFLFDDNLGSLI